MYSCSRQTNRPQYVQQNNNAYKIYVGEEQFVSEINFVHLNFKLSFPQIFLDIIAITSFVSKYIIHCTFHNYDRRRPRSQINFYAIVQVRLPNSSGYSEIPGTLALFGISPLACGSEASIRSLHSANACSAAALN